MGKAGGYLMLFGLLLVAIGLWRAFAGGEDAIAAMVTGGVIVLVGFLLAARAPDRLPETALPAAPALPETPAEPPLPDTAWFSVIESVEDEVIDEVAAVLATDPRITHIEHEQGRYYSNPDRDDLPEWFALRCECRREERDQVMEDAARLIAERLGQDAANRVSIRVY